MVPGVYELSECDVALDFASLVASSLFCPVYGVNVIQWAGRGQRGARPQLLQTGAGRSGQSRLCCHHSYADHCSVLT